MVYLPNERLDMSTIIPLLHRLVKLRDLHIEFEPVWHIVWLKNGQPFPELQLLEIFGPGAKITS
jgi:hypothetical protein